MESRDNIVIKRVHRQTCLSYAEREQFRRSQLHEVTEEIKPNIAHINHLRGKVYDVRQPQPAGGEQKFLPCPRGGAGLPAEGWECYLRLCCVC